MSLKKSIRKSIAALVAILLVNSNCYLCGIGLSKVIAQDVKEPDIKLNLGNSQYVQFKEEIEVKVEGEENTEPQYNSGVAIQTKLEVGIEEQETNLPIIKTELMVFLPSLNGYFPQRANVVDGDTLLSTGEENNNKINQNYDSNSGLLSVSYENEETYSNYNEESKDEFEIIYIYPAEAYTGNEEEITLSYTVNARITFETENAELVSELTQTIELKEKDNKGNLVTFGVTELKNEIYKGFMYANIENGTNYDTEFNTVSTLCVLDNNTEKDLVLEAKDPSFIIDDEEGIYLSTEGLVQYVSTGVNKSEFDKILGQDGVLEVYTQDTLLATVKYIEVSENEEVVKKLVVIYSDEDIRILSDDETMVNIEYISDVTNLKIKTTKPVVEGFIIFENKCIIKPSKDYGIDLEEIKGIKINTVGNDNEHSTSLLLKEPQTKVTVSSSNINFSTLQINKTTLIINLDSTNASTKLFDNPTITVKLPDGLVGGNLSSPEIVNGNGLKIKNTTAKDNVITIELEGKQTEYDLTNVSGGASIVMDIENIDFMDTLPTHTDKIEVKCTQGDELKVASCDVNIISKDGLLMLTTVSNYDSKGSIVTTLDNSTKTIEIENDKEEKEINKKIIFVNNYDKEIKDIQIVGKLGELDSTFSTSLKKEINVNKSDAKVYYSENIEADYNDDSWTEEYTDSIRAYKIVLSNNELKSKDNLEISLSLRVPEKLQYNQYTYLSIGTNYSYENQTRTDKNNIIMQTPQIEEELLNNLYSNNYDIVENEINAIDDNIEENKEEVSITTQIKAGNNIIDNYSEVFEGQTLKYKVAITNNTNSDKNNLKLRTIINNAVYYEKRETDEIYDMFGSTAHRFLECNKEDTTREVMFSIPANTTKIYEYQIVVNEDIDNIVNDIELFDSLNESIAKDIIENKVKDAKLKLKVEYSYNEEREVTSNSTMNITLYAKNLTSKELKNVPVKIQLPAELNCYSFEFYGDAMIDMDYDEQTHIIDCVISNIPANSEYQIVMLNKTGSLDKELSYKTVTVIASSIIDNVQYISNELSKDIKQIGSDLNLELTNDLSKPEVSDEDIINYTLKITNDGIMDYETARIFTNFANGVNLTQAQIIYKGGNVENIDISNNIIDKSLIIHKDDQIIVKCTVKLDANNFDQNAKLLENIFKVSNGLGIVLEEESTLNIAEQLKDDELDNGEDLPNDDNENTDKGNEEDGGDSETPKDETTPDEKPNTTEQEKYTISGIAWLDLNKDGQRNESETLQENIIVSLIDMTKGDFALDSNGNKITTTTTSEGKYTFSNIQKGTYAIIFEFDTNTYTVATYQKEGINKELNSDVILSTVTINGEKKLVGLTDRIELTSNIENIDIGLIENARFNLSLDKKITEITLVDKQGTESYEYEEGHTAKVDLVAKYMKGANVIVNYKFTVTNNGDITGYVDSLLDSLPSGLEFSSELNKDWYKGTDGNLYTNSLSGKAIKPGESVEVELVLTKTMTEENAGTFVNNAKLEKISNLENINEKEVDIEDNESSAILIISIKTGSAILYIGITTMCLAIIGIGIYLIKKKVLNRGI